MAFFTHQVNGQTYGGWYRQLAPHEIEIMGAGFLCKTSYAGCDELSVARSVLEEFVHADADRRRPATARQSRSARQHAALSGGQARENLRQARELQRLHEIRVEHRPALRVAGLDGIA